MSGTTKAIACAVVAVLIAAVVAGYYLLGPTPIEIVPAVPPPILYHDSHGFRYTYHVTTGFESLYELASDPDCLSNLAVTQPKRTLALRRELEERIGVGDLDDLQEHFEEHRENLRGLGYL